MEPAALVLMVTEVPLMLMVGADGFVPWMVISLVFVSVVLAGAAGTPPVAVTVAVSVSVMSLSGKELTFTTPELLTVA